MATRRSRRIRQSRNSLKGVGWRGGGWKLHFWALFTSFAPRNFRSYWLSGDGLRRLVKIGGTFLILIILVFLYFAKDLPSPGKINSRISAQTTQFYDRTGKTLLYELHGDKNRTVIDFPQMPDNLKNATVAVEDKSFYSEGAFSFVGILRAAIFDLIHRGTYQGGSTITQQYVKNALLDPADHSFGRKIKELILSLEIGQFYSKNDVLKLYLNEIPYGSQAYGVEAAAKTYFSKDAKDLTLPEAALLAAIPRAPSYYSPYGLHRDSLVARQHLVLDLMAQQHYITQAQADGAKWTADQLVADIPANPNLYGNIVAPHFVLYVQELLEQKYGVQAVDEGGLKVTTTLDIDKQKLAEDAVKRNIAAVRRSGGSNAALVAGDPKTGQILAMVGSYDFSDPKFGAFNVAISNRQPGSSFKPIVYATAFSKNYGPGTTIYDVPTDFGGGYKPTNYSGQNYGVQSMRTALDGSLNIPAVKTLYLAGLNDSIANAHKMGITTLNADPQSYGLALVLGAGDVKLADMVNAYETFANGGNHYAQTPILKITDPKGNTLEEFKQPPAKQVLDPQVAYLISNVLSDNGARAFIFGANNPLTLPGRTVAAKTGTTTDFRDAWTMGFTPSLVTGAWAGNNDNKPMTNEAVNIAAPIWHDFMLHALATYPNENFVQPAGIKQVTLDTNTGKLPGPDAKATRTDIFPSWYKPTPFTDTKSAVIDTVSGKLATDCTPPLAKKTVYSSDIHAEIPPSDLAYSRWEPPVEDLAKKLGYDTTGGGAIPTQSDDAHHCNDTKPQVVLTAVETPAGSGNYHLKATVTSGTFPANKLDIYFDDQVISTQSPISQNPYAFDYQPTTNGNHTFKAVVTDSGLYQADNSVPVTVTNAGGSSSGFQGVNPASGNHVTPGLVTFSWTIDPGATGYDLYLDGVRVRQNVSGISASSTVTPGSHQWYVTSHNTTDHQTTPIAFSSP